MDGPAFDTVRACPYHGGWIRLAECPIVALNDAVIREPGPAPGGDWGFENLGRLANARDSEDNADQVPLGDPIGPSAPTLGRRTAGKFRPGTMLVSRMDDKPRMIVSAPPGKKDPPERRRRFTPNLPQRQPSLPSPAALAAAYGGARARPVRACPDPSCQHPLPATIDLRDPISIVMVGNSQASKTTTVAALMSELRRLGPEAVGVSTFSPSEATSRQLRTVMRNYINRNETARTQGQRFHAALEFTSELGPDDAPVTVMIHDVAGEDIMDPNERLKWAPYVLWADAILFVYNPEESPRLRLLDSDAEQSGVLTGVLEDLENNLPVDPYGRQRQPALVVAVSKADLLPSPPHLGRGPAPEEEVKQTLIELGDGGVVHAARRWPNTRWCFIAPLPPAGEPEGVTDLFRLLLSVAVQ